MTKTGSSNNIEDNDSGNEVNSNYDELFDKLKEMLEGFQKLAEKHRLLKMTNSSLRK